MEETGEECSNLFCREFKGEQKRSLHLSPHSFIQDVNLPSKDFMAAAACWRPTERPGLSHNYILDHVEHLNVETIVIHESDPSPRSGAFRKGYSRREAAPSEKIPSDGHPGAPSNQRLF